MQVAEDSQVLHELSSNQNIETGIKLEPILSSKINFLQEPSLSSRKLGLAWFVYIHNCMIGDVLGYQRCANSSLKHILLLMECNVMSDLEVQVFGEQERMALFHCLAVAISSLMVVW